MNTELLQKINQIGKDGIVREGIFVRFPDLLPAVRVHYIGDNYIKQANILDEALKIGLSQMQKDGKL